MTSVEEFMKEYEMLVQRFNLIPVEEFRFLFERMYQVCEENDWGDPFNYSRAREIHMAGILGHEVSKTLSGADAFDEKGPCEYKSTTVKNINGAYNGISVQSSWEEQERYLKEEKIGNYTNHYSARYVGGKVVEIWKLDGRNVLEILLPKLRKKYNSTKNKKDPRLGTTLTKNEINRYGEKIYEA